jgi:hypothetical protein
MLRGYYYYSSRHEISASRPQRVLTPPSAYHRVHSIALRALLCEETDWFVATEDELPVAPQSFHKYTAQKL